jgi:hypothetical protein
MVFLLQKRPDFVSRHMPGTLPDSDAEMGPVSYEAGASLTLRLPR